MKVIRKMGVAAVLFAFVFLITWAANASIIVQASFDEVAQKAEFVFEGRVISKETRPSPMNNRPVTYFTFEIIDIIKGSYSEGTLELGFAGGTLNGLTLSVSDMHMPEIGEKGIYFVESLTMELVHPLYGWHQGHFLVTEDPSDGTEKVVPVLTHPSKMSAAPTVREFKQNARDRIRDRK